MCIEQWVLLSYIQILGELSLPTRRYSPQNGAHTSYHSNIQIPQDIQVWLLELAIALSLEQWHLANQY